MANAQRNNVIYRRRDRSTWFFIMAFIDEFGWLAALLGVAIILGHGVMK